MRRCTRCHKKFPKTKTRGNYCSLLCKRITIERPIKRKTRKKNFIRTYVWSPLQGKTVQLRSSYELTYVKWLETQKIPWIYEEFYFNLGKFTYLPDFYLPETKEFVEVKGRWMGKAKEKFELFKELYPKEKITLIQKKEIMEIRKAMKIVEEKS